MASKSLQCYLWNVQGSRSLAEINYAVGGPWGVLCLQDSGKNLDLDGHTAVVSEPQAGERRSAVVVHRAWAPHVVEHWSGAAPWLAIRFAGSIIALMTVYLPHSRMRSAGKGYALAMLGDFNLDLVPTAHSAKRSLAAPHRTGRLLDSLSGLRFRLVEPEGGFRPTYHPYAATQREAETARRHSAAAQIAQHASLPTDHS